MKRWAKKVSEHQLQELIAGIKENSHISVSSILESNGYSFILDGIDIDGSEWENIEHIDFSRLSLKHCKFLNISVKSLNFTRSDMSSAILDSSVNIESADFTLCNMQDTYISKPIKLQVFNGAIMDGAIIVCGSGLVNILTCDQYSSIFHIKVEEENYFSQEVILERYNNLSKLGVCNGLSIAFAKHIIAKEFDSYVKKINKFLDAGDLNFSESILDYQVKLQTFEICSASEVDINMEEMDFFYNIPHLFKQSNVIGITIKGPLGAHIIAVGKKGNGYIIFDPNIGEIQISMSSKKETIDELNKQIFNIHRLYKNEIMAFDSVRVSNLEAVINEVGVGEIDGKRVKKYDMSLLYVFIFLAFCIGFFLVFDFTDDYLNAIIAVPISIFISSAISVYLATVTRGFYTHYIGKSKYERL